MGVFKAYDIRGIYPSEINEDFYYKFGRAFVAFLSENKICVGRDVRLSSDSLFQALVNGLVDSGAEVYDIGICTTDMMYFAVFEHKLAGGLMVTASHNPKEYNGIKVVREKAIPVSEETGLKKIQKIIESGKFNEAKSKGKIILMDIKEDYADFVQKFARIGRIAPLNVVVDASNGAAALIAPRIFQNLRCNATYINFNVDGSFPGHGPNPTLPEARQKLSKIVLAEKADLGIVWDADADRCIFIDDKGRFAPPDFILGILAEKVLVERPKSKICYDVRSSHFVRDTIKRLGGRPFISKVGAVNTKLLMRENKIFFGGELSGHYCYKYDDFYTDNGIIPALQILEIISTEGTPLSKLLDKAKGYFISGELNFSAKEDSGKIIAKARNEFKNCKFSYLDGITVTGKNFWFNLRASNTEPFIRLTVESENSKVVKEIVNKVSKLVR